MEQEIKTVKIRNGEDFTIINESDFDADQHELFEPTEADADTTKPAKGKTAKK